MSEKNPFFGATFAERKAIREAAEKAARKDADDAETKQVDADNVEDKAVKAAAPKKRTARKRA